ncbi:hypothetical protein [Proteiniphilum sp. UBA5384]|uniref:hypothetical protein n=1 Tax=Proteiniphilum sp. UBA5384 TaxID=1947279 RepID=UPI0025CDED33|nr:hypothetical protein [Proteiniphilum sp. UBA5384]
MVVYFLLKAFTAFLIGKRGRQRSNYQQKRPQQPKQPESQEERIIEYQKKNFESSDIEDADYVEIKEKEK